MTEIKQLRQRVAELDGKYSTALNRICNFEEMVHEYNKQLAASQAKVSELEKDAARYQWIKDATGETPLRPAAYNSEFPDTRLRFDFPTIISYDAVGNVTTLDAAIDAAMQKERR